MPFLEGGILGTSLEKVLVGTVQVAKRLLNGHRGAIREPGILFFEVWEHGREVVIGQFLTMLGIGSFAGVEPPIVHEAAASEHLRKDMLLFVGRIEPIFVCPLLFAHCLFPFLIFYIAFHCFDGDTANCPNIVGVGPQRGNLALEIGEFLPQLMSSCALNEFDQPMNPKLWIAANDQMDMVRHDFHFYKFLLPPLNTFLNERLHRLSIGGTSTLRLYLGQNTIW
jgi:hypothetical protein